MYKFTSLSLCLSLLVILFLCSSAYLPVCQLLSYLEGTFISLQTKLNINFEIIANNKHFISLLIIMSNKEGMSIYSERLKLFKVNQLYKSQIFWRQCSVVLFVVFFSSIP